MIDTAKSFLNPTTSEPVLEVKKEKTSFDDLVSENKKLKRKYLERFEEDFE